MTKKQNSWAAPQRKTIRSVDVSAVVFKQTIKKNPYIRSASYRALPSKSMTGLTNSEAY
jgi:hypothetical protein